MKKRLINRTANLLSLGVLCFTLLSSLKLLNPIILLDETTPFVPKRFFITRVIDERVDKSFIAQMIIKDESNRMIPQTIDLKGGTAVAITQYMERNVKKNRSLKPIIVRIKDFRLIETPAAKDGIDGQIRLLLSFGLEKNYGQEFLLDYKGSIHYIRHGENFAQVESQLRGVLKSALNYFNTWMEINADVNKKLANGVKLKFTNYRDKLEGDTIYYAKDRPLTWSDFQSRYKPMSNYMAEVMPGMGYDLDAQMSKGIINANISLKTYLPKSTCRANYEGRNSYTLNHEQRHFDIVKIITDQFKKKILLNKLTPDNYEAIINMQYLDSYRDMDAMQKAYDKETSHGLNKEAQSEWNNRIDKELKSAG
jgi:hypothetical protein